MINPSKEGLFLLISCLKKSIARSHDEVFFIVFKRDHFTKLGRRENISRTYYFVKPNKISNIFSDSFF